MSWGFAFKKGLIIFLWSILWMIVGGIVGVVISGGAFFAALPTLMSGDVSAIPKAMVGLFLGIVIGSLISSIGVYATIVKITVESSKETTQEQVKAIHLPSNRFCPYCGEQLMSGAIYCMSCGRKVKPNTRSDFTQLT